MRFAAAIGQRLRGGWRLATGATLTLATLSAVIVVGLTLLASDVLASWKAPESVEQAMAASGVSEGPLTFEAPASTVLRLQTQAKDSQKDKELASNDSLLVKDWKHTQFTLQEAWQLSRTLYFQAAYLRLFEQFLDSLGPLVNQQLVDQYFTAAYQTLVAWQGLVNAFIPPALRPPAIPPASPSV